MHRGCTLVLSEVCVSSVCQCHSFTVYWLPGTFSPWCCQHSCFDTFWCCLTCTWRRAGARDLVSLKKAVPEQIKQSALNAVTHTIFWRWATKTTWATGAKKSTVKTNQFQALQHGLYYQCHSIYFVQTVPKVYAWQPCPASWRVSLAVQRIWDSLMVRVPDSWSKSCEFESQQEQQENFLLQSQLCVLTLIQCLFHPRVSAVACKRPRSFYPKIRCQVYTWTHIHSWPNEVRVGWLCCCPGKVWEPIQKQAHMQLVGEHLATDVSACWATVDWSWHKEWNSFARADLHFKKKKMCRWEMNGQTFSQSPRKRGKSHHHHHSGKPKIAREISAGGTFVLTLLWLLTRLLDQGLSLPVVSGTFSWRWAVTISPLQWAVLQERFSCRSPALMCGTSRNDAVPAVNLWLKWCEGEKKSAGP